VLRPLEVAGATSAHGVESAVAKEHERIEEIGDDLRIRAGAPTCSRGGELPLLHQVSFARGDDPCLE
jgi:hypothetical protein